jgi:hypothetical protein
MRFKLDSLLHPLPAIVFAAQTPVVFSVNHPQHTSVAIRGLTPEEQAQYTGDRVLWCTVLSEEEPPGDVRVMFERLARNLMPDEYRRPQETFGYTFDKIDDEGRISADHVPPIWLFPNVFGAFVSQVHQRLTERIRQTVRVLRWRFAIKSPHDPIERPVGLMWALADETWRHIPGDRPHGFLELGVAGPLSPRAHAETVVLLESGVKEPLGHALFLEAWTQVATNPRSALVLGIAAAEVGLKECVGKLVPDAQWLVSNVPSPPLHKMVAEYLPLLPTKGMIQGRILPPPRSLRRALGDGIEARNHTTHVGAEPPEPGELRELLLSVRDLLYLLDAYCGFDWALHHIRQTTRDEMRSEFRLESVIPS